jgi:hypothetical protein
MVFSIPQILSRKKLWIIFLLYIDKRHHAWARNGSGPKGIEWAKIEVDLPQMVHDFSLIFEQNGSFFPPFISELIQFFTVMIIIEEDVIIFLVRSQQFPKKDVSIVINHRCAFGARNNSLYTHSFFSLF